MLAVGGLLLMHGLDARGHGAIADTHLHGTASAAASLHGDHEGAALRAATGSSTVDDAGTAPVRGHEHGGLGHVMAMCVAVLAAAGGMLLRRLWSGPGSDMSAFPFTALRWARLTVEDYRPPGPGRLALCVLRI